MSATTAVPAPDAPSLLWAKWYSQVLGWCVFPLSPNEKTPLTANGFHAASRDIAQIEKWWTAHPYAGIGIPAGPNGLVILDFDPRKGGVASYNTLIKAEPWPEWTPRVRTGGTDGGRHFYFRSDQPYRARTILPGCDVRAGMSYVVCPPSIHPSGKRYVWEQPPHVLGVVP